MKKSDSEVEVALTMGSSSGLKAPTGRVAAKKTAKKGTAAVNITAEEVNKIIDEMSTQEEKQKMLMENGIKATGDER
jgi:K+-transporting ATPase c subunit